MRVAQQLEKKADVSELIVDAAERLLKAYGYQKMTMTDLAAEAGIGVGTTYLHFTSKAEVVLAVVDRHHAQLCQGMRTIADSHTSNCEKLRKLLSLPIYDRYERCREILTTLSWQQFQRHGAEFMTDVKAADRTRIQVWRLSEVEILSKVIEVGIREGEFIDVEPVAIANTLLSATCCFMPPVLEQEDFARPEIFEARVGSVISLLLNGLIRTRSSDSRTAANKERVP